MVHTYFMRTLVELLESVEYHMLSIQFIQTNESQFSKLYILTISLLFGKAVWAKIANSYKYGHDSVYILYLGSEGRDVLRRLG